MKDFFKNMGKDSNSTDSNFQHYNKLLVYWGECLGPIWFMENHSDIFPENSKVYMPPGVSEGLWDFKVNESQISVLPFQDNVNLKNIIKKNDGVDIINSIAFDGVILKKKNAFLLRKTLP